MNLENIVSEILTGNIHPAFSMSFDDLFLGLEERVEKGIVDKKEDEYGLCLYNYNKIAMYDNLWDKISLLARGLIIDPRAKRIVSLPFPKFFNFGEIGTLDSEKLPGEIVATDKMDGSLGICFKHPYTNKWQIATRGSFVSDVANWANAWLNNKGFNFDVDNIHTYLVEIIYRLNRVVVPYKFEGFILIGSYDNNGKELNYKELQQLSEKVNIPITNFKPFDSVEELLAEAKKIPYTREGWVIRFANGHRIKIKGDDYCFVHRNVSNVTPISIWEALYYKKDIDSLLRGLPEEHTKDFNNIINILNDKIEGLYVEYIMVLKKFHNKVKQLNWTTKDIALSFQNKTYPKEFEGQIKIIKTWYFIYAKRDFREFFEEVYDKKMKDGRVDTCVSSLRRNIFMQVKPKANNLDDYEPSDFTTMFSKWN